jgi:signal transduction histidine kinase
LNRKFAIALLLIVALPLVLIFWIGWRSAADERLLFERRIEAIRQARLHEQVDRIRPWQESLERELGSWLPQFPDLPLEQREGWSRRYRFCEQAFAIDSEGRWAFPDDPTLMQRDAAFRRRIEGALSRAGANDELSGKSFPDRGWITWYEGPGPQWAFWVQDNRGAILGLQVDRSALIADLIGTLPDESSFSEGRKIDSMRSIPTQESFLLLNEEGHSLYRWGDSSDPDSVATGTGVSLPHPFGMWKLHLAQSSRASVSPFWLRGEFLGTAGGLALVALVMLALGIYLFRESARELERAKQRVSFVNQVSHELKTPLTNIQLYSELLDEEVTEPAARKHLNVIQEEARKLGRMIQNVLTFARQQRKPLQLHLQSAIPDEVIATCVASHRIALERRGIMLHFSPGAPEPARIDPDVLCQILGNLLSNAEKYAPGAPLQIRSLQDGDTLEIHVRDSGSGISSKHAERIFEPFVRLQDRVTEGISGTGIGLGIARDLARLHGGDITLQPGDRGAHFIITLNRFLT